MLNFVAVLLLAATYAHHGPAVLPDAAVTPGLVRTTDANTVCTQATGNVRHVSAATKAAVYAAYHATKKPGVCCEVDHLIPLELGGDNGQANLRPQPYAPKPGAHEKDVLENFLHRAVCGWAITLQDAQRKIASDSYAAYLEMRAGRP